MRYLGRVLRWVLIAVLACVLASAGIVLALRWIDPPTSAFMIAARIHSWTDDDPQPYRLQHSWRDLAAISPQAAIAVVASEDQQFPMHRGFDVAQIRKAMTEAERGRRARGASTITQQTAKNLFLWPGQSWIRKGLEAYFTLLIETFWSKTRILEVYLNVAEFGPGVFGVGAASEHFFRQSAARLNRSQSALLAAVLPNPTLLRVNAPSRYVRTRQAWILQQMNAIGGEHHLTELDD